MTNEHIREELDRLYGLPPSPLVEREIAFLSMALASQTKGVERVVTIQFSIKHGGQQCKDLNLTSTNVSTAQTMEAASGQSASR